MANVRNTIQFFESPQKKFDSRLAKFYDAKTRTLDLGKNDLVSLNGRLRSELPPLLEFLKHYPVRKLIFGDNTIDREFAKKLTALTHTTVTHLNLNHIKISAEGLLELAGNTNLSTLHFRSITLTAEIAQAFPHLTELNFSYGRLDLNTAQIIAESTSLTTLTLWRSRVGEPEAITLARSTTITSLLLGENQIGDAGAMALAKCTQLLDLNLWDNNVGITGSTALAAHPNLTRLDLGLNNVGAAAARVLVISSSIKTLGLSGNLVNDQVAIVLATTSTLTSLDLTGVFNGNLTGAGVVPFIRNTTLVSLGLTFHPLLCDTLLYYLKEHTEKNRVALTNKRQRFMQIIIAIAARKSHSNFAPGEKLAALPTDLLLQIFQEDFGFTKTTQKDFIVDTFANRHKLQAELAWSAQRKQGLTFWRQNFKFGLLFQAPQVSEAKIEKKTEHPRARVLRIKP